MTSQHFLSHTLSGRADQPAAAALTNLYRHIRTMYPLEEPDWALFQTRVHWEHCPKGARLLYPGQVCNCLRFLHRGAVIYYEGLDEELQLEQVSWIAQPGEMVVEISSFFQQTPTRQYLKCTADCAFLSLSYENLQTLYAQSAAWNTVGRRLVEQHMLLMAERTRFHQLSQAREKYRYFTERFPQALQLVSQRHIAAFLGIRPETLSRLRRKKKL